jgi:predicted nucleic acid-binding Zn ribbon protein
MPWRPLPTPDGAGAGEPRAVADSLDRVARRLGVGRAATLPAVFDRWAELVGEGVAARAVPRSLRGTTLVVAVDDPSWATQLRWLEADLVARIGAQVGAGVVTALELVVRPASAEPRAPGRRPLGGDHDGPS